MSDYDVVKKLCNLSRLEIGESEFQKTADKIKETISFFDKLDELEMVMDDDDDGHQIPDDHIIIEKKIDDLREDVPKSSEEATDTNNHIPFDFLNRKNGYAIGPRI
jgi:aspartyl/glutamyl-tRNA(Asn/Gln) amidotransferase C subunit